MIRGFRNVLLLSGLFYLGVLGYYTLNQRDFMYFPSTAYTAPEQAGTHIEFEEFKVTTEDSVALKGWYVPPSGKPFTILYFHGNADDLRSSTAIAAPYIEEGYGFMIAEYRGYSGMPGSPTENGLYADGRAFLYKMVDKNIPLESIILMGHSLGTGVATQLATEFHVAGVALFAPFLSMAHIAQNFYPIFPTHLLVFDRYANVDKVSRLSMPLIIIHGDRDEIVPLEQGRRLYDLAKEPKKMHLMPTYGHNDLLLDALPAVFEWLEDLAREG